MNGSIINSSSSLSRKVIKTKVCCYPVKLVKRRIENSTSKQQFDHNLAVLIEIETARTKTLALRYK
jgi:ribosomal protein S17E